MLYQYCCKDMGLKCNFVARGKTQEEVDKLALEHVLEHHKNDFNRMQTPKEIEDMRVALSKSVRVVAD